MNLNLKHKFEFANDLERQTIFPLEKNFFFFI